MSVRFSTGGRGLTLARVRVALLAGSLCALVPAVAAASGPKVFVQRTEIKTGAVGNVERELARAAPLMAAQVIASRHNCAQVTDWEDIRDLIEFDKTRRLLGNDDETTNFEEIAAGALGARYLVSSTLLRVGREFLIGFMLLDVRRGRTLARVDVPVPPDAYPTITGKTMKQIVDAIPACQLSMDIQIAVAGTIGSGTGRGSFAGTVDLEADDSGRITGKGAVVGGMAMDDAPAQVREDVAVTFKVPFGITGSRDEENVAHLTSTGGMASFSTLQGKLSGGGASGGGETVTIPWRAGAWVEVQSKVPGGGAVTRFVLRTRSSS